MNNTPVRGRATSRNELEVKVVEMPRSRQNYGRIGRFAKEIREEERT